MIGSNSSGLPETNNTTLETPAAGGPLGGADDVASGFNIKLSHGSIIHDVCVLPNSTFGDLKRLIPEITGKLLFRGKEKEDCDQLQMAGVKDNSKVVFMEAPSKKELNPPIEISRGGEAVAEVKAEVDKLSEQVSSLQAVVKSGTKVEDKQIVYLTEMLMRQLLKLDGIEAEGVGKIQRKEEVRRVQGFVDTIDTLKAINSNPFIDGSNTVSVPTQLETLDSGTANTNAPTPVQPCAKVSQEWEQFD